MQIKVNLVKIFGYRSGDFSRYLVIGYNILVDTVYLVIEI